MDGKRRCIPNEEQFIKFYLEFYPVIIIQLSSPFIV